MIGIETEDAIKRLEIGRLRSVSGVFEHISGSHEERLSSLVRQMESEGKSKEEIAKRLSRSALGTRISGKYWKGIYRVHETNINFGLGKPPTLKPMGGIKPARGF